MFKIIKVPKMTDVTVWLFDNLLIEYPDQWLFFKTDMNSISRFIVTIFQKNLKAIYLINQTTNHLYNSHDPLEVLMFYKTLVQQLRMSYYDRYAEFNKRTKRKEFIDTVLSIDGTWNTLDAIALYELNRKMVFKDIPFVPNETRMEYYKDPKKKMKHENSGKAFDDLKEAISKQALENAILARKNDSRYLTEISQPIIDSLELTIFNVKTLPKSNQILFIFIDKDNSKRFYIQDFNFIFYVSNKTSILENDYVVPYDEALHVPFIIREFEILRNLKFAINDNYSRFMKKGQF